MAKLGGRQIILGGGDIPVHQNAARVDGNERQWKAMAIKGEKNVHQNATRVDGNGRQWP